MADNDYTSQALIERITLKAFTSSSTSLTPQQILNLANDSLRSFIVPLLASLRDEWFVGKTDISVTTNTNGEVTIPDSVASTLRTVAWSNAGILYPLTRIEPEASYRYQPSGGSLPVGYELRGYTLIVLPRNSVTLVLTAMLRPPQMVLTSAAGLIDTVSGAALTLDAVPLAWQSAAPTEVDLISGTSPFSRVDTFDVSSLNSTTKVLTLTEDPGATAGQYVSDVDTSPFANVPSEFYAPLEQDVIVQLFAGLGDKREASAVKRRDELVKAMKAAAAPRMTGNARPIVNYSAPGMRSLTGFWPRR